MKRLHVHVRVADLDRSIEYYDRLFERAPDKREHDYARWRLDDPAVNFAISTRCCSRAGIQHLGLDFDTRDEFHSVAGRMGRPELAETDADCCYARSDKAWYRDPDGVEWEAFHTKADRSPRERRSACGRG